MENETLCAECRLAVIYCNKTDFFVSFYRCPQSTVSWGTWPRPKSRLPTIWVRPRPTLSMTSCACLTAKRPLRLDGPGMERPLEVLLRILASVPVRTTIRPRILASPHTNLGVEQRRCRRQELMEVPMEIASLLMKRSIFQVHHSRPISWQFFSIFEPFAPPLFSREHGVLRRL
jgi:hypothetical protein